MLTSELSSASGTPGSPKASFLVLLAPFLDALSSYSQGLTLVSGDLQISSHPVLILSLPRNHNS